MNITGIPRGVAFDAYMPLVTTDSDDWQATPTIASGDAKVSKDGGSFSNLATTPTESPASSGVVKFPLSASEMDASFIIVRMVDQTTPKEWKDTGFVVVTQRLPYLSGSVNDASATTTQATLSSAFPATADALVDMAIVFLNGNNAGLSRQISAYTSGRVATFDAFPNAPANGDLCAVIGVVK